MFVFLLANVPEWASQGSLVIKNSLVNAGDTKNVGSIPELGRSPGIENYNLLATCELGAAGRARAKGNAGSPSALGTRGPRSGDVTELLAQDPAAPEGRVQRCSGSRTFPPSGLGGRSPKKGDRAFRNGDACFWDPTQAARSQRKQSLPQPVDACP